MTQPVTDIPRLVSALEKASKAYYAGNPIITDAQFDALEAKLQQLDPSNPWFSRVRETTPSSGWVKTAHSQPMGSLDKCQNGDDTASFVASIGGPLTTVTVMDKLDGASLSLEYRDGVFYRAITRGDGIQGEDITRNVQRMRFPKRVPGGFTGFLRGEVIVKLTDFQANFPGASNPRNTATGTMKRQSDAEDCQYLTVFAYDMVPPLATKRSELDMLKSWGFDVPRNSTVPAFRVEGIYQDYIANVRKSLDYWIDGLVVAVDSTDLRESFGYSGMNPRGSMAYKFPHEEKESVLRNVVWQVGKSGRVTPVAEFDTVDLGGAQVERASLHNVRLASQLASDAGSDSLREGDQILVSKRNDIIPMVEVVLLPNRSGKPFLTPSVCPSCTTKLEMEGEYLVCRGDDCPAQVKGAIVRWLQKTGVLHFGAALVETLIDNGLVNDASDLYGLDPQDVSYLDMGGRRVGGIAARAFASLHATKNLDLHTFLGSLGIPLWGRSMCRILTDNGYDTLSKVLKASAADIASLPGVGDIKAQAFVAGLEARSNLVGALIGAGVTIKAKATGHLVGKSMCVTGFRDAALEAAFEAAGGVVKSSVGKGLTYLVAKDPNGTSEKLKKARAFGTQVVSEEEIRKVIGC